MSSLRNCWWVPKPSPMNEGGDGPWTPCLAPGRSLLCYCGTALMARGAAHHHAPSRSLASTSGMVQRLGCCGVVGGLSNIPFSQVCYGLSRRRVPLHTWGWPLINCSFAIGVGPPSSPSSTCPDAAGGIWPLFLLARIVKNCYNIIFS